MKDHQSTQTRQLADDALYRDRIGSAFLGAIIHEVLDIPLSLIQLQTSGVAFAIRAAMPTNARLLDAEVHVIEAVIPGLGPGPRVMAPRLAITCDVTVQGGADSAGSIIAPTDVEVVGYADTPGLNMYQTRSGQILFATLTTNGDPDFSALTAGHLAVGIYYTILP